MGKKQKRTSLDSFVSDNITPPPPGPQASAPDDRSPPSRRRERVKGTVSHSTYLPVAVHEQLRRLAFEERAKMHDYLLQGLDLVFRQTGLPTIAELKAKGDA
jgi:hypothetical protein